MAEKVSKTEKMSNTEKMQREDAILSEMNDGRLVKMEVDYSSAVDKAIPEAEKLAQVSFYCLYKGLLKAKIILTFFQSGQLQKALDTLYSLEKQSRLVD